MLSQITPIKTPGDLGALSRSSRNKRGKGLKVAAPEAGVGVRFLSEFERGKPTVELGKAMKVLQAAGLELAIVQRPEQPTEAGASCYSRLLGTDFPYDWSNSNMDPNLFIRKVLLGLRFNDLLRIVSHFGMKQVAGELPAIEDRRTAIKAITLLSRIQQGMLLAKYDAHHA